MIYENTGMRTKINNFAAGIVNFFKKFPRLYSVLISIYYFFRFMYFAVKERSFMMLRYFPGHYSSTIPSKTEVQKRQQTIFQNGPMAIEGVDLNEQQQIDLLLSFRARLEEFDFPGNPVSNKRYYYNNPMFRFNDAFILYCFLHEFNPGQIIETGSGFSSALTLDTLDMQNKKQSTKLVFIEPNPGKLYSLISDEDNFNNTIIEKNIQDVSLELFDSLGRNDFLFVDTSHVLKVDSDLSTIMFHILPRLKEGVIIHFHDIFWPFEYPRSVFNAGRNWNEAYILRTFLQYNDSFEIVFFSSYLECCHRELILEKMPGYLKATGSSLWLRKKSAR